MHESSTPAPPEAAPSRLDFTPVPVAARRDGWTPRRQRDFIRALAAGSSTSHAARAVGMSKQSAYKLRERPGAESFAAAWDAAAAESYVRNFDMAIERVTVGIAVPRFYRGRQIATIYRPDYRLALAVLAAPAPPSLGTRRSE